LIHDLFKGGQPDQEKMDAISKVRESMADQILASQPGVSRTKAVAMANEQLAPLIDKVASGGGRDWGEVAMDAAALGMGGYMAHKAGVFGKKTNPNAPTPGGPATSVERVNGTTDAASPKMPSQADTAKQSMTGNANLPAKYMGRDEPEAIHNAAEEALEGTVERPSRDMAGMPGKSGGTMEATRLPSGFLGKEADAVAGMNVPDAGTGFSMGNAGLLGKAPDAPFSGGASPMDQSDLLRLAMAAKMRQRPRAMGAFAGAPIEMGGPVASMNLTDSMRGQSLNAMDAARMRQMLYGANGG
jgi:hypothetical protein